MDALKHFTSSSKHALESKSNKDLNGMILFGKPQQLTIFSLQNPQVSHHSFSCMDMKQMPNTWYWLKKPQKYLGDNEGVLNVQLMMKLLQVVAYNLAKSRAA